MTSFSSTAACSLRLASLAICSVAALAAAQPNGDGLELSVMQRTRYETLDPQYRAGFGDSDEALALQTAVVFDWSHSAWHVGGELMDARTLDPDANSFVNGTTTNTLEPIQAFVAWRHDNSAFRFGRVAQDIGKRRLIGRNRFRNTVNTFTGIDWSWAGADGRAARAFYWLPMRTLPVDLASVRDNEQELDRAARDSFITGVFYQFRNFPNGHRLEAYVFDAEAEAAAEPALAFDLVTLGARAYRAPRAAQWNYEVEAVLQDGDSSAVVGGAVRSGLTHRASFLHFEIGYQFDVGWSPNLMLQYDRATGDEDPSDSSSERFNTLFGPRRFDFGPTGIYGIAARSNIDSPGIRLTMRPAPRWQSMFAYRALRLDAARDVWVGSGWRDTTGAAGTSIGRHLEGSFTWAAVPERLSIETGFAYLAAGRFATQTAGAAFRGDPRYFYTTVTTTF